jgi:hypothetical protein
MNTFPVTGPNGRKPVFYRQPLPGPTAAGRNYEGLPNPGGAMRWLDTITTRIPPNEMIEGPIGVRRTQKNADGTCMSASSGRTEAWPRTVCNCRAQIWPCRRSVTAIA